MECCGFRCWKGFDMCEGCMRPTAGGMLHVHRYGRVRVEGSSGKVVEQHGWHAVKKMESRATRLGEVGEAMALVGDMPSGRSGGRAFAVVGVLRRGSVAPLANHSHGMCAGVMRGRHSSGGVG